MTRRVLLVGGTAHGEVVEVEGDPSVVQLPAVDPQPWSVGAAGDDVSFSLQTYYLRAWVEGLLSAGLIAATASVLCSLAAAPFGDPGTPSLLGPDDEHVDQDLDEPGGRHAA